MSGMTLSPPPQVEKKRHVGRVRSDPTLICFALYRLREINEHTISCATSMPLRGVTRVKETAF